MKKPDSNLTPDSQPWSRRVDADRAEDREDIDALQRQLEALIRGDGGQATLIAGVQSQIEKIVHELTTLYGLTGNAYPPTPGPPVPPPASETTVEMAAAWSRTWGSSSFYTGTATHTNGTYLYQGSNPENKVGMWRFDVGPAAGKNIIGAAMFLQNIDSPYQPSFVASFGTHGNVTAPAGKPGRVNGFDVGWGRGEGKWIGIPDWAFGGLSNGSIQGFTVGASGASDANYAFFMGVGQARPPVLKLTYK